MQIKLDLSEFTGRFESVKDKVNDLPGVLAQELASLLDKGMTANVPVSSGNKKGYTGGMLKSSIRVVQKGKSYWVGPTIEYAPYPVYYGPGRGSSKKSTTYMERAVKGSQHLFQSVLEARAQEYLTGGF